MNSFKTEYDYLIHLLKCAVNNEKPMPLPNELSFNTVFKYGMKHDVANLAFYSIEKLAQKPCDELYEEWQMRRDMGIARDINQSFARDEIIAELEKNNIRSLEVQGTVIKTLYPQTDYRTMSDLDFIADAENLQKIVDILTNLGYECEKRGNVDINAFREPNINIEFHTQYFPYDSDYYNSMPLPFSSMDKNGEYDVNQLYIYNMLHIAKHYFTKGCGIRRVLDVYFLNNAYDGALDKNNVDSVFKKAGIDKFVDVISRLAEYWFGNGEYDQSLEEMAINITNSKLHGSEQKFVENRMREIGKKNPRFVKLRYILNRAFPGDKIMLVHYPFLDKKRFLYPFCWAHRLIRCLFVSRDVLKNETQRIKKANIRKKD